MLTRAVSVLVGLVALAAPLATAAPAQADRETVVDPVGDAGRDEGFALRTNADLVRTRAEYDDRRFTVTATVADLTGRDLFVVVKLVTSDGLTFWATKTLEDGEQRLALRAEDTRSIDCDAIFGEVEQERDRARVSVAGSCIGSPEWIRWGVGTRASRPDRRLAWTDDGRADGGTFRDPLVVGARRLRND